MSLERPLESLSDDELLRGLSLLLRESRRVESHLVAHIGEVETRHLYAREASPSMFVYCTDVLHLSEAEAYLRLAVARAAREHPVLLAMLTDGRLHLTGIAKLATHLTPETRDVLLSRAVHKSKRQIEELLAELFPRPDAPSVLRKLPERPSLPGGSGPAEAPRVELGLDGVQGFASPPRLDAVPRPVPAPPVLVQPLSPARYKGPPPMTPDTRNSVQNGQGGNADRSPWRSSSFPPVGTDRPRRDLVSGTSPQETFGERALLLDSMDGGDFFSGSELLEKSLEISS
jgi:hypothetical protein